MIYNQNDDYFKGRSIIPRLSGGIKLFIARQPIFNKSMKVYGYELLYRDSETATFFGNVSGEMATARVLGGLFEIGLKNITDGKRAFINFDYCSLLSDSIELINPSKLIIEVLEDVKIDFIIQERLKELKKKRYRIALDDFIEDYRKYPIFPISNIIKFDVRATPLDSIRNDVAATINEGKIVLAEKVETEEEFEKALDMGFHLFQGYFFKRPRIVGETSNKKSIELNYLRILTELNKEEPSYYKIAEIIETDVNLSYRLLRTTKANKTDDVFNSIKQPLVYMGFNEIRRWINILLLQDLIMDKPAELMKISLIRSKFGSCLAKYSKVKVNCDEVATMLLFSALDAILDLPMEDALAEISLTDNITQALIKGSGKLSTILEFVLAYEQGVWDKVKYLSSAFEIEAKKMQEYYLDAIKYCNEITDSF